MVIALATKILARVLIVNGPQYIDKFSDKTGGFVIMQYRLKRWWSMTSLWVVCLAILFGRDVARLDLQQPFELYSLISLFPPSEVQAVYPQVVPVLVSLLQAGLKAVIRSQPDPASPPLRGARNGDSHLSSVGERMTRKRAISVQAGATTPGK